MILLDKESKHKFKQTVLIHTEIFIILCIKWSFIFVTFNELAKMVEPMGMRNDCLLF